MGSLGDSRVFSNDSLGLGVDALNAQDVKIEHEDPEELRRELEDSRGYDVKYCEITISYSPEVKRYV